MSTTATAITAAVAHDTRLLELLHAAGSAYSALDAAEERLFRAASNYSRSHTGEVSWSVGSMPKRAKSLEDIAAGTLYHQSKTFTRGEEGWYVGGGEQGRGRRANIDDALAAAEASVAAGSTGYGDYAAEYAGKALAARAEALTALIAASAAVTEHELAYTGWNRYFLVTSSAGHVHRSMHCSTCNPRTTYSPVVALSGQDDAAAVELLGETLCTVCFPEAPVDGKPSKITAAKARKLAGA